MSTTLERSQSNESASQQLRAHFIAVKLSFTWLGTRKSLSSDQKALAANTFAASEQYISATKRLLDTQHPLFRAVTTVRSQAIGYWKSVSLPYPEPALRLIKQQRIETFNHQMADYQEELQQSVRKLDEHFEELKNTARDRLGSLFDSSDYPESITEMFAMEWSYPSIEPPSYLQELNPEIFVTERNRVAARFDEAVQLAEEAFTAELAKLVSHLSERLSGESDGKPKVFRDSAIDNLTNFFERFRDLNIGSNPELDSLVEQAQLIVRGVAPQELRENLNLREHVAEELQQVQATLDELLVDRPRRNIIRRSK